MEKQMGKQDFDTIFFIHLVYKLKRLQKMSQKDLEYRVKTCNFAGNFTKSIKIAAMQRQKFNTLGVLNIQSTCCLECNSYMLTSSIVALFYSDRKTFHIARGGSGLLLT